MYSKREGECAEVFVSLRPCRPVDWRLTVVYGRFRLFVYNKVVLPVTALIVQSHFGHALYNFCA